MMGSRGRLFLLISMIAILSIVLAACTGDDDDANDIGDAPVATPTPADDDDDTAAPDANGDPEAGQAIWQSQCQACHTIDGSDGMGPTWQGLWMSDVPLEDGTTVTADEEYITESIREPNAKVHEGFPAIMPAFDLDDDEIAGVIAFIQTLDD